MSEENEKYRYQSYPSDILDPDFDMSAYRDQLLKEHEKAMQDQAQGLPTWHIAPAVYDVYSEEYDVDQDIADKIATAKGEKRLAELKVSLSELIDHIADQFSPTTPRARDVAIGQGALTTIHGRIAIPSTKEFVDIFAKAKVIPIGSATRENGEIKAPDNAQIKDAWDVNAAKMAAVLQMAIPTYENGGDRLQVYLPSLCGEMNIDPRKYSTLRIGDNRSIKDQRFDAFASWFAPVEKYMLPLNGVYYRACTIESYDDTSETVTLNPSFFLRLLDELSQTETRHAQLNRYFHADVANEENEIAIAVAFYLANNLLQRGETNPRKDGIIEYRTTYATIISNCRQLKKALADITGRTKEPGTKNTTTQLYNTKLKRIFETAYRLILEKSDFPLIYKDLKINGVSEWEDPSTKGKNKTRRIASKRFGIPTKSRITDKLTITHRGRNEVYIKP